MSQVPFALQPKASYTITFKARISNQNHSSAPLIVDFFGDNYDFPEQEAWLDSSVISTIFQEIRIDFDIGTSAPSLAYLRFFTLSNTPYEIEDVRLIQNSDPASPAASSGGTSSVDEYMYKVVHKSADGVTIYENLNFLPRARFVKNLKVVTNSKRAINILWNTKGFNPLTTALVEGYSGPIKLEAGEVIQADYSNENAVVLSVRTGEKSFLILSDSWYPGWKAFVDNKETKIYKTNAALRGILIEGAGNHVVEFRFVPRSFYLGLLITGITLTAFILCFLYEENTTSEFSKLFNNKSFPYLQP